MRYEYIAVYKIDGINWDSNEPDKKIAHFPEYEASVTLTSCIDEHCFNADRGEAVKALILNGLIGRDSEDDFKDRLEKQIAAIRQQRERFGKGAFLIFRGAGEENVSEVEDIQDFGEFGFYLGDSQRSQIKERFQNPVNGVLAALSLSLDAGISPKMEKIVESSYCVDLNSKVIYCYRVSMTVTAALARRLTEQTEHFVGRYSQKLGQDKELIKVVKLLTQSAQGTDNLRAFLSAWVGLEIFVGKMFNLYEDEWIGYFTSESSPVLSKEFFRRTKDVLKERYRLQDKFLVISSLLVPGSAEVDYKQFDALKKIRDKLTHGEEVADADLPTAQVQELLRKLLRFHLEKPKKQ